MYYKHYERTSTDAKDGVAFGQISASSFRLREMSDL